MSILSFVSVVIGLSLFIGFTFRTIFDGLDALQEIWDECKKPETRKQHGAFEVIRSPVEFLHSGQFRLLTGVFILFYGIVLVACAPFSTCWYVLRGMNWARKQLAKEVMTFIHLLMTSIAHSKIVHAEEKKNAKTNLRIVQDPNALPALKKKRAELENELADLDARIVEAEIIDEITPGAHPLRAMRRTS